MSDKPISPLRQRMIDDMTARRFTEDTQRDYVRNVRIFAAFLGRSPDTATREDLRRFQLHMARQQISPGSINAAIAALRFFFTVTLERPDLVLPLTTVNEPCRVPVVLSQEEVARLLEAAPGLKYKAALSVACGAGLRVSEVANLKVSDIDSKRMTLRVEQGKGQRDRYVMLSPQLLELLRDWWHAARPQVWLFPGQNPINPMTPRQLAYNAYFPSEQDRANAALIEIDAERMELWIRGITPELFGSFTTILERDASGDWRLIPRDRKAA